MKFVLALCAVGLLSSAQDPAAGLKSKVFEERLAAVSALAGEKDPKADKALVGALKDEDWEIVERAAAVLGERKSKSAIEPLVKLALEAPAERVRRAAATALGRIDPSDASAALVKKTSGADALLACQALAIAARGGATKTDAKPLVKIAEKGKEIEVRAVAAAAAVALAHKDRTEVAKRLLDGGSILVRCAVLDELAAAPRAGDLETACALLHLPALDDVVERRARKAAVAAVLDANAGYDLSKVGAVLTGLVSAKEGAAVARGARLVADLVRAKKLQPDGAFDGLKRAISHADAGARAAAAHAFALVPLQGSAELLRAASRDSDPRVRWQAVWALPRIVPIHDDANSKILLGVLAGDADPSVRRVAATTLGFKGLDGAIAGLTAALADKDWSVAVCAAVSLGKTQSSRALEPLSQLRTHPDWKLRGAAVVGLTRLYQRGAVKHVIPFLADADLYVRTTAHSYLMAIAREKLPAKVETWEWWWSQNESRTLLVDPAAQEEMRKRFTTSGTAAPEIFRGLDTFVLESRGDHIEKVLASQEVAAQMTMAGKLDECPLHPDAMFVANCSGEIEAGDVDRLRWFVLAGGHLFGSCWALSETIQRALPGVLAKYETQGEVVAHVPAAECAPQSPYLEGVFGEGVRPIYALEGAHLIELVDPERAEVLIDSPFTAQVHGCGNLAAWFEEGHGTVMDSVNHFEEQGLANAERLKTPIDRQAYAVDHMGLSYAALRALRGEKLWDSNLKAAEKVLDLSVFRLITNFVRLRRLAMVQ